MACPRAKAGVAAASTDTKGNRRDPNHREPRPDASNEAAEPAQPPTTDEERDDRFLAVVLECPEQLCADECADQTEHGGIECCLSSPLRANEGSDRDEDTEARDFKAPDAKERRIHRHLSFREIFPAWSPHSRAPSAR